MIPRALGFITELTRGDAAFFAHNPLVAARLEYLAKENPHYLAHELLHATWEPMAFDAVARDMGEVKCGFIGSATLLENIDALSVPPNMAATLAQTGDVRLREVLRDLGASRTFRRDLYRRGADKPLAGELTALLDEIVLTDLGAPDNGEIIISTGGGSSRTLDGQVYAPLRERLRAGPLAVGELRRSLGDLSLAKEVVSVLCATEAAHPMPSPEPSAAQIARTDALNRVIGLHNRQGGALKCLVTPKLGTGLAADTFETMVFEEFSAGMPDDLAPAIDRLMAVLLERGVLPQQGGVPSDADGTRATLRQALERFITTRLPLFQRVGILPGAGNRKGTGAPGQ